MLAKRTEMSNFRSRECGFQEICFAIVVICDSTTLGKSIDGEWKRTYFSFYRYWKWNKGKASNKNPQSFL